MKNANMKTLRAVVNAHLPLTDNGKNLWTVTLDGNRFSSIVRQTALQSTDQNDETVLDAKGKPVLPGFIDAHMHPVSMGLKRLRLNLGEVRSLHQLLEIIKKEVTCNVQTAYRWVIGYDWDESLFTDERRYPTCRDLDSVSLDLPVALRRIDGHLWVVNTKALKLINPPVDNPFVFKTDGQLNGLIADEAIRFLEPFVSPPLAEKLEALKIACQISLRHGVTTMADLYADFSVYDCVVKEGDLPVRFVCALPPATAKRLKSPPPWDIASEFCEVQFVKLFLDGSIGAHTAAVRNPYTDDPLETGRLFLRDRILEGLMLDFNEMGWGLVVHAIGDLAIDQAIESFRFVRMEETKHLRHRIEHLELLRPEHLSWIKKLSVIASMQPNFVARWQIKGGLYETRLGWERAKLMNPFASVMKAGISLAFGSDGMPFGPIYGIVGALSHPEPNERLNLLQALSAYTRGSAFACGIENKVGTIEPNKLADFIVLSHLPDEANFIEDWETVKVEVVVVGGKIRFIA